MGAPAPRAFASGLRLPRATAAVAFGSACLVAELALAAAIASPSFTLLLVPFLAAGAMALVFRFPFAMSCLFLVLTVSILHGKLLTAEVGPIEARAHEVLLGALLVVAAVRPVRNTLGGVPGAALLAFFAALLLSGVLAILAGRVSPSDFIAWVRPFFLLCFFFVVVRLFPQPDQARRLLVVGAALAALSGAVAVLMSVSPELATLLQDRSGTLIREQSEGFGILKRVQLPGLALAYSLFCWVLVRALDDWGNQRLLWALALAGMAASVALSFWRNMWLGLAFGLALMVVIGGTRLRGRLLAGSAVGAVCLALVVGVGAGAGQASQLQPLVERGASLLDPESVGESSSLRQRRGEIVLGWQAFTEHPVTGIGPGGTYGRFFNERQPSGSWTRVKQRHLHNQYLYLALIGGVPALASFLTFLVSTLRRAWGRGTRDPQLVACGVGLALVMLSATVELFFSTPDMLVAIALLAGTIVVLTRQPTQALAG